MLYHPLGATGERVSAIGFGTGDNAGLLVRGAPDDQCRAFERALELGINYWDTSPDYGDHVGLAEINLGNLMRQFRVRPLLTTKVEVMPDQLDDVAGRVERSLDDSLRRLQTDWVDVLQIHNPPALETDTSVAGWIHLGLSHYLGPRGVVEGLERARRAGKVRYLGFACEHADPRAVRHLLDARVFSMINVWYDLLNPTAAAGHIPGLHVGHDYDDIIGYASQLGVGVASIRPLSGGALTDHAISGGARHPLAGGGLSRNTSVYQEMVDQARPLAFLSQPAQHSLAQAAYRFVLNTPGVTTVLGGFSELAHLEDAAASADAPPISAELMARVELVWRANFGRDASHLWASA